MASTIPVFGISGTAEKLCEVVKPAVFDAPIRPDVVQRVHTMVAKNRRQAYAVNMNAGMQHSAESWGTGRAKARIPRVKAAGTNRSSEGAFGNMCRGGRMFAPTKTYRRWHVRVSRGERRYATAAAIAASGVAPLVEARGHRVDNVPQIPLVVDSKLESINKTKALIAALKTVNAWADAAKVKDTRKMRSGRGKMRGRKWVSRKGPLVVYSRENSVARAARNVGVDVIRVENLDVMSLAPGGHVGRFIVWTQSAFEALDGIWASKGVPRVSMSNTDLSAIVRSSAIQKAVRPSVHNKKPMWGRKINPLNNKKVMMKLNPHYATAKAWHARNTSVKASAMSKKLIVSAKLKAKADIRAKKLDVNRFWSYLSTKKSK